MIALKILTMKKKINCIYFFFLVLIANLPTRSISQNIGIGVTVPTRAKLEVNGAAGSGYTSGIFGADGAGISLQRNWPTIGFNQYNDGMSRFMSNGYASIQYLDPSSGTMAIDMLGNGTTASPTNLSFRALTIANNGN